MAPGGGGGGGSGDNASIVYNYTQSGAEDLRRMTAEVEQVMVILAFYISTNFFVSLRLSLFCSFFSSLA